jgi:hypothetical protein
MYEAHGWLGLAETPHDIDDGRLDSGLEELRRRIDAVSWPALTTTLERVNGFWFLTITCCANRRRGEADYIDQLINWTAQRLPGSWGLVYDRDDEMPEPYGPKRFRVKVIARGHITESQDQYLSPTRPTIED